jgi:uncharacterized protein YutE (UPF0331/DUF86 family)
MHVVRKRRLGAPQDSRDAFKILQDHALLDKESAESMKRMVGFRDIAIHEYDTLNLDIVRAIITQRLDEILVFG